MNQSDLGKLMAQPMSLGPIRGTSPPSIHLCRFVAPDSYAPRAGDGIDAPTHGFERVSLTLWADLLILAVRYPYRIACGPKLAKLT
jgi:hypothetical protein